MTWNFYKADLISNTKHGITLKNLSYFYMVKIFYEKEYVVGLSDIYSGFVCCVEYVIFIVGFLISERESKGISRS